MSSQDQAHATLSRLQASARSCETCAMFRTACTLSRSGFCDIPDDERGLALGSGHEKAPAWTEARRSHLLPRRDDKQMKPTCDNAQAHGRPSATSWPKLLSALPAQTKILESTDCELSLFTHCQAHQRRRKSRAARLDRTPLPACCHQQGSTAERNCS